MFSHGVFCLQTIVHKSCPFLDTSAVDWPPSRTAWPKSWSAGRFPSEKAARLTLCRPTSLSRDSNCPCGPRERRAPSRNPTTLYPLTRYNRLSNFCLDDHIKLNCLICRRRVFKLATTSKCTSCDWRRARRSLWPSSPKLQRSSNSGSATWWEARRTMPGTY